MKLLQNLRKADKCSIDIRDYDLNEVNIPKRTWIMLQYGIGNILEITDHLACQAGSTTQKTWSGLSPKRNPVHLRLWILSFNVLWDVPSWDSAQTQSLSSIGLWSDPKSEFSGTKSPDPDPLESQICLLGMASNEGIISFLNFPEEWYL